MISFNKGDVVMFYEERLIEYLQTLSKFDLIKLQSFYSYELLRKPNCEDTKVVLKLLTSLLC